MSLDMKFATICLAASALFLIFAFGAWFIQRTVDRAIVSSGHAFYVAIHQEEPRCATCPMNKRCQYYGDGKCKLSTIEAKINT